MSSFFAHPTESVLESALRELLGEKARDFYRASNSPKLDLVADEFSESRADLLDSIGHSLGIATIHDIVPPSEPLIQSTGFTRSRLRALGLIPQPTSTGYCLALSDPDNVDLRAFAEEDVPLAIAYSAEIEKGWALFERAQSEMQLFAQLGEALGRLSASAAGRGALELFLGQPSPEEYEFTINGEIFRGSVTRALYDCAIRLFHARQSVFEQISTKSTPGLSISLLRDKEHPIVCLWWPSINPPLIPLSSDHQDLSTVAQSATRATLGVLDDDRRFGIIVGTMLRTKGFEVVIYHDSQKFLADYSQGDLSLDLLICDVHMPGLTGASILSSFNSMVHPPPVIMLTSDEDSLLQAQIAHIGAAAFVRKREDPRVLLAWIDNVLQRGAKCHIRS